MSKMASVSSCGQFSQGVPENPGQTSVAKKICGEPMHTSY